MTVRVYQSTDASAPTLKGNVTDPAVDGSLAYLLNACLVTGYGAQTAAGWTSSLDSATDRSWFRTGGGSNGFYLQVDEGASPAANAYLRGYETMSTPNAGTNPFPRLSQFFGGGTRFGQMFFPRSSTNDATVRRWMVIATERTCYVWVSANAAATARPDQCSAFVFGDFVSYFSGDVYNTILVANQTSGVQTKLALTNRVTPEPTGHYIARPFTQIGGSTVAVTRWDWDVADNLAGSSQAAQPGFPNETDLNFRIARLELLEATGGEFSIRRGYLPGLWIAQNLIVNNSSTNPDSGYGIADGDTFTFLDGIIARTVVVKSIYESGYGALLFETSDTW